MLLKDHVQLLKADWTQYDPVITRELAAVGRSGVPTYVLYPVSYTHLDVYKRQLR